MIKVKAQCKKEDELYDLRPSYSGLFLGLFKDVARQHGVLCQYESDYVICSAPQNRMQVFVDKLDCCAIGYEVLNSNESE